MQKTANFLRGSIRLEVTGPYPERFFNICAANGVGFWEVEQVDDTTLRLTVPRSRFRQAEELGKRCMCEVRPVQEWGLPEFLLRFRRRYGMLVGLVLALAAVFFLSGFVLVIDVTGNERVSDAAVLSGLREAGFGIGSWGPGADVRRISNSVLLEMEELGFLSINIHGIRAEVVVRETDLPPEVADPLASADIAAERDGYITQVQVLSGEAAVEEGQAVLEGEILISGTVVCESGDGSGEISASYRVTARGEVWAQTLREYTAVTPLTVTAKEYTGREDRVWSLRIFSRCIKMSARAFQPYENCDKITEVTPLTLGEDLILPLALVQTTCREYRPVEQTVTEESAQAFLREMLICRLEEELGPDGQVLSAEWVAERRGNMLSVTLTAVCSEEIGTAVFLPRESG